MERKAHVVVEQKYPCTTKGNNLIPSRMYSGIYQKKGSKRTLLSLDSLSNTFEM